VLCRACTFVLALPTHEYAPWGDCRGVHPPEHNSASIERAHTRSSAGGQGVRRLGGVPFRALERGSAFRGRMSLCYEHGFAARPWIGVDALPLPKGHTLALLRHRAGRARELESLICITGSTTPPRRARIPDRRAGPGHAAPASWPASAAGGRVRPGHDFCSMLSLAELQNIAFELRRATQGRLVAGRGRRGPHGGGPSSPLN